eukprot:10909079-Alexandrium_andersonii.AAC.1
MCIRDRPRCVRPYPSGAPARYPSPSAGSGCGPCRPVAHGSAQVHRTHTHRPCRLCQTAARTPVSYTHLRAHETSAHL